MTAHRPTPESSGGEQSLSARDDQYLWDGAGKVDPTVARLEQALSRLRYRQLPLALAAGRAGFGRRSLRAPWLRAAAMLGLSMAGIAAISLFSTSFEDVGSIKERRNLAGRGEGWNVVAKQGSPRVGSSDLVDRAVLHVGEWVETDAHSKAEIQVGDIGQVTVDASSRVRLVAAQHDEHRLELAQGRIDAFISGEPRRFMVDTPAATAVDLGCVYTLVVGESGAGMLKVTLGWVSLEWSGRESIVPRRAECQTRPGIGPGTPMFDDAPEALRNAVEELDFGAGGSAALAIVLQTARDRDSLTLWHLMVRVKIVEDRARLIDRLMSIEPLPAGVTREAVLGVDAKALMRWREEFPWSPPFAPPPVGK